MNELYLSLLRNRIMRVVNNRVFTDFFSAKGQECLSDNVITIGYCFLSALPDDEGEKQNFLFKLIEGKECK